MQPYVFQCRINKENRIQFNLIFNQSLQLKYINIINIFVIQFYYLQKCIKKKVVQLIYYDKNKCSVKSELHQLIIFIDTLP